jgi:sporulation protein YlmC with PRC-barrel domain
MKHLMLSTALLAGSTFAVMAQDTTLPAETNPEIVAPDAGTGDVAVAPEVMPEATEEAPAVADAAPVDGYEAVDTAALTSEELTGARVYDSNDEWIGEVSELVLTDEGQISNAVVDVGGFLGIGEKPVALELGEMNIVRDADGSELRIEVAMTKEQLEALPRFEG